MDKDWQTVDECPMCGATEREHYPVLMPPPIMYVTHDELNFPVTFSVAYEQCLECGLIYQNPSFTDEARDKFYSGGTFRRFSDTGVHKKEIERGERLAKLIEPLDVKSVLDIGCGRGDFLKACKDVGVERAIGVELTYYAIDGTKVVPELDCLYKDELFGIVSLIHYLEHTVDPVVELKRALSYSNRYVLVEVPHREDGGWAMYLPHTLIFKPWTLVSAFERAGMQIVGLGTSEVNITIIGERKEDE